ncbi:MAG: hypothetical protein Ta2G_00070 [Termitinemataceae bacterium]|nr:MAG: hypothetical protein Ta2G_00070 [Termitinemataceae bacterium]
MNRFFNCNAVVLKQRSSGTSNREAFFLTETLGIIPCTVYGGSKSKLKAIVSQFHSGILYCYHDPVRGTYKVQDFDVKAYRMGLRENYMRTMTAIAICETVFAGHGGGGNWTAAISMIDTAFDAMENAGEQDVKKVFVHFLWNWANLLGVLPDISGRFTSSENAAILKWLQSDNSGDPESIFSTCPMNEDRLESAKNYCYQILSGSYGRSLNSWKY